MRRNAQQGFTLVELMVTIAVAGIIAAIAAPSMVDFVRRGRVTAAGNEMIAALQAARTHAVTQRATVSVCPTADGNTCNNAIGTRWIVRSVKNGVATVVREVNMDPSVTLKASPNLAGAANTFTFRPNGFSSVGATGTGTLSACVSNLSAQNALDVTSNIGRVSSARRAASSACTAPADG